jgi:glycerophosphoryl diester phosphodiesterase
MASLWLTAGRTLNIGHRGASRAAPQNTLAAFRQAAELGADGVELDVHLSADGVPVVIHDFVVDHTTDGTGAVAARPLAALKELDAGGWFDPAYAGERIPTLAEVMEAVGDTLLLNIELKVAGRSDGRLAAAVVGLVTRFNLAERVLLSSFEPTALLDVRRLAPHLPLGFLYDPLPSSWPTRLRARGLHPQALHPHHTLARPALIRRAHKRGQRVVTWTVDEPAAMARLIAAGIDAIITNYPDRLRLVLEGK